MVITLQLFSLFPFPILLLLIVIYDGVGTYNETIIEDWYVDDNDDVPVPILSHNDNYCISFQAVSYLLVVVVIYIYGTICL